MEQTHRRAFLAAVGSAATATVAGCSTTEDSDVDAAATTDADTATDTGTATVTVEMTSTTGTATTRATTTAPGRLVVEDVTVETTSVEGGKQVAVEFFVKNPGDAAVNGDIVVRAAGRRTGIQIELGAGDRLPYDESFHLQERGSYEVRVDGEVVETVVVGQPGYRTYKYDAANTGRGVGSVASAAGDSEMLLSTDDASPGGVVADADTAYVGRRGDTTLTAVDIETGDTNWEKDTGEYVVRVVPVLDDGTLYTAAEPTSPGAWRIRARDAGDGTVDWDVEVGSVEGMTFSDGLLYVTTSGYHSGVFALQPDDGSVEWSTTLADGSSDNTVKHLSPPAVADGTVYATAVTSRTGVVYAVDAESGERSWTKEQIGGSGVSPPVVGENVYVRSLDGLHTLAPEHGELGYSDELAPGTRFSGLPNPAPALVDGTLYGCTHQNELQALDVADDTQSWAVSVGEQCGSASPVVVDGTVVFQTAEGTVRGFDTADGSETLTVSLDGSATGDPAFVVGSSVVATTTTGVHVVDVSED